MKRPDTAIKAFKSKMLAEISMASRNEILGWIDHLESQLQQQINIDWPEWSDVVLRKDSIDDPHDTYMFARHNPETNNTLWSAPGMFSHEVDMSEWHVYKERDMPVAQPRKTVSDAVDYFDGVWRIVGSKKLSWCYSEDCWSWGHPVSDEYQVCTREEFEAEVERRKGEIATGEMPELIEGDCIDYDGQRYYVYFNGMYYNVGGEQFMGVPYIAEKVTRAGKVIWKRKPTISNAEADAIKAYHAWTKGRFIVDPDEYLEQFEVK